MVFWAFSVMTIAQLIGIPIQFYKEYLLSIFETRQMNGLEWVALNRANFGYDNCVAALCFWVWSKQVGDSWQRSFLTVLAVFASGLVFMSWSKGPIMVIFIFILAYFMHHERSALVPRFRKVWVMLAVSTMVAATAWLIFVTVGVDKIIAMSNLNFEQSIQIRLDLLRFASFPLLSDVISWFFGRGFGWSRWGGDSAIFVGSGTHVFWLDLFLEVGLIGLLAFIGGVFLLYRSALKKMGNIQHIQIVMRFVAVVLIVKLTVASDTYSEPLLAMVIGLLFAQGGERERK